jgi:drug/metabolite transporter (DMT)-like permease
VAYLNVKKLGATGEPGWRVVFWFTVVSTAVSAAWLAVAGFTVPGASNAWTLLGVGATATVAQYAMTRAYHTGNTLVVGAFSYSTVVFSTLFGIALWGEHLEAASWAGMALIIGGGVLSLRAGQRPR